MGWQCKAAEIQKPLESILKYNTWVKIVTFVYHWVVYSKSKCFLFFFPFLKVSILLVYLAVPHSTQSVLSHYIWEEQQRSEPTRPSPRRWPWGGCARIRPPSELLRLDSVPLVLLTVTVIISTFISHRRRMWGAVIAFAVLVNWRGIMLCWDHETCE